MVNSAANLKGRLLLAHGTGDDNVHMENMRAVYAEADRSRNFPTTCRFIRARRTPSPERMCARILYNRILAQFEEYLKPPVQ